MPEAGRVSTPPAVPSRPNPGPSASREPPQHRGRGGVTADGRPPQAGVHYATRSGEPPPKHYGVSDGNGSGGNYSMGDGVPSVNGDGRYSIGGSGDDKKKGSREVYERGDSALDARMEKLGKKM